MNVSPRSQTDTKTGTKTRIKTRSQTCSGRFLIAALFLPLALSACHRRGQAVEGVAGDVVQSGRPATSAVSDRERAQLEQIPLPTKSRYADVTDPSLWANPLIAVGPGRLTLRITLADANHSTLGEGTFLRPPAARRQELQLRLSDLDQAVADIPSLAWPYGRVIAVAGSPSAPSEDQPAVRRNLAATIRQLTGLGIVVEEWPGQ